MRLLRLSLRNFKGIRQFTLQLGGADATVYGDNGVGKSTLMDAWMWLLFGKDSHNRADFEIKTLDSTGKPIHNLEHEVEAELELTGGRRLTLRKVYKEVWTKRRGAARAEFTGHTTEHYIDGVPVRKAEFEACIGQIADEQLFRLLTDPLHFNMNLHWQDRRRILLEACGDVTDAEVIASDPALTELPGILEGRSIDQHRKVVLARRTELNRELDRIPVRIDEVRRNLPELPANDRATVEARLAELRSRRQELSEELVRVESGGQTAELQRQLAEVQAELRTATLRAQEAAEAAVAVDKRQLRELEDKLDSVLRRLSRLDADQRQAEADAAALEQRIVSLRQEWHQVNARQYDGPPPAEVADACAACGQALPADQVETARARAQADYEARLARFNETKAAELERIQQEGKALRAQLDETRTGIERRTAEIQQARAEAATLQQQVEELRQRIAHVQPALDTPEMRRLRERERDLTTQITLLRQSVADRLAELRGDIRSLDDQIRAVEGSLARFDQHEQGLARIAELEAEERRLAAEFEELERQLHLLDEFVRAKVRLLTDRINSRFRIARFKLFEEQVNGGIAETCECMVNGVPYNSLNHGARIQAGLDIIQTLGDHYGFRPPIFVDNAESVTDIPQTTAQQIRLVVSAGDRTLRVVTHETAIKEAV
ncbi:MAG: hypothetical protein BAA04_09730 [Firmicutes bacterium ZCTH02-B6]|nr:MAG: hypothetical protein BAA04_09730 [Firmicutes bacterium ZCTH02-B6]